MTTRRDILKTIGASALSLTAPFSIASNRQTKKRPNIVLILADDMGGRILAVMGEKYRHPISTGWLKGCPVYAVS